MPPFVKTPPDAGIPGETDDPAVKLKTRCPVFEATGACRLGYKCRFLGGHIHKAEDGTVTVVEDEEKKKRLLSSTTELNFMSWNTTKLLRSKKVTDGLRCALLAC